MGTKASALLVNDPLEDTDADFLAALGFKTIERVQDWKNAHFGFVRYKNSFIIFAYGQYENVVSQCIEADRAVFSTVLGAIFPESKCLAVVLQSSVDLAGFALFSGATAVRRSATAAGHGVFVDVGAKLPAEIAASTSDSSPEDVVHAVTKSVMGFDLREVFEARDVKGTAEEALFHVEYT